MLSPDPALCSTTSRTDRVPDEASIVYLTVSEVVALHDEILRAAGQPPSPLRDRSLLESALQRPRHAAFYENADIITQAALYMAGIVRTMHS
jgi:prophage maintenance system killer protein